MVTKNKLSDFIIELNSRTKKNLVNWIIIPIPLSNKFKNLQIIEFIYQIKIKENIFILYLYQTKYFNKSNLIYKENIKLELVDENYNSLFDIIHDDYNLNNLYISIKNKTSGISDVLNIFQ